MTQSFPEDVLDVLDGDHRALLALMAAAGNEGDDELTPAGCERLAATVVRHFVAAEIFLLPLVRAHIDGGGLIANASALDHRTTEDILRRLEGLPHQADAVRPVLADAAAALRAHIDNRDNLMFPELRRRCDPQQLSALAAEVTRYEELTAAGADAALSRPSGEDATVTLRWGYLDELREYYRRLDPSSALDDTADHDAAS